jgi:hypothetical protein
MVTLITWFEGSESFSSEYSLTGSQLRAWFNAKIKEDHAKMHSVTYNTFENNIRIDSVPITKHRIIAEDCKSSKTYYFKGAAK